MGHPDVVIIGGGIIGAACAHAFSRRDLSVTILNDGAQAGIATPASAGMLAPLAESRQDHPLLSLNVLARDLYRDIVPQLEDATGIDVGYRADGILQVAFDEDDATHLKNDIAWQRQQGLQTDWVAAEEVRDEFPGLSEDVVGGKLAPEDGGLEPQALQRAFTRASLARGVSVEDGHHVHGITLADGKISGVTTDKGKIPAGHVVIAAGAWSGQLTGLPRPLTVLPVRGQMVALAWPAGVPPSIIYSGRGYVMHRNGEALAGSTMEHVGFDASTTEAALATILATARRIYPALVESPVLRQWAGLRPVTPDGMPLVGPDPEVPGLWYATGHGRNGILLAGLTSLILGQLLLGEPVDHDLRPLDPGRFWQA